MKYLPRKSIRPIIALLFAFAIVVGFFAGRVNADVFVPIVVLVITYYFKSRDESKQADRDDSRMFADRKLQSARDSAADRQAKRATV